MSNDKRRIITIHSLLAFLNSSERLSSEDYIEVYAQKMSTTREVVTSMLDIAEDLGYITDLDSLTAEGLRYLEICRERQEIYGTLTLVRGLPGAGKTHLGHVIVSEMRSRGFTKVVHLESDQFMLDENGHYKFQADKVKMTNVKCIAECELYLHQGYDVVVTNVFAQYWELKPYYDIAAEMNIKTTLIDVQSQYISERRSAKTRHAMAEKWEKVFLPRSWASHTKEKKSPEPETVGGVE